MKKALISLTILVLLLVTSVSSSLAGVECSPDNLAEEKQKRSPDYSGSQFENPYANLALNLSRYNTFEQGGDSDPQTSFGLELIFNKPLTKYDLLPSAGLMRTSTGSHYIFGSITKANYFTPRLFLNISFGGGAYFYSDNADEVDLGHVIEFRTAVGLHFEFLNKSRLGLEFFHLSNAGIGESNPGSEVLSLAYSVPVNF